MCENHHEMIDETKAHLSSNNGALIIYKRCQMLLLAFLQLTIHDDPSPDLAETFSSKVTSE